MAHPRDNQRSRCYAWENAAVARLGSSSKFRPDFTKLEECQAFADPIWRAERGRVGLARQVAPSIERPNRGQQRALAHHDHRITLPRWARSRWVILHELAHRLTPADEAHGPRFVGVLIGLVCRHLDYDAPALMVLASEFGVKFHVRSIGVVPTHGAAWHVERAIRTQGPMEPMDLASWLSLGEGVDIDVRQVRGAALALIRAGKARWYRNKLVLTRPTPAPVATESKIKRVRVESTSARAHRLAEQHGITIEREGWDYWVWCDALEGVNDPREGDHMVNTIGEALAAVEEYVAALQPQGVAA